MVFQYVFCNKGIDMLDFDMSSPCPNTATFQAPQKENGEKTRIDNWLKTGSQEGREQQYPAWKQSNHPEIAAGIMFNHYPRNGTITILDQKRR